MPVGNDGEGKRSGFTKNIKVLTCGANRTHNGGQPGNGKSSFSQSWSKAYCVEKTNGHFVLHRVGHGSPLESEMVGRASGEERTWTGSKDPSPKLESLL